MPDGARTALAFPRQAGWACSRTGTRTSASSRSSSKEAAIERQGLTGELFDHFRDNAVPHAIETFREPLLAGAFPSDSAPRTYFHCRADGPVRIPTVAPGWTIQILPTGHWPMLTMPVETADALGD